MTLRRRTGLARRRRPRLAVGASCTWSSPGLGVSGFAAADALQHVGAQVTVLADRADADSQEKATLLEILGVTVRLGEGATTQLPDTTQLIVTSPGLPPSAPIFARAAERGTPGLG